MKSLTPGQARQQRKETEYDLKTIATDVLVQARKEADRGISPAYIASFPGIGGKLPTHAQVDNLASLAFHIAAEDHGDPEMPAFHRLIDLLKEARKAYQTYTVDTSSDL